MKKQYLFSHLMGFIEGKVVDGTATPEEEYLYQDYKWLISKALHIEV